MIEQYRFRNHTQIPQKISKKAKDDQLINNHTLAHTLLLKTDLHHLDKNLRFQC